MATRMTRFTKGMLPSMAVTLLLAGACSPEPAASKNGSRESSVEAFNRRATATSTPVTVIASPVTVASIEDGPATPVDTGVAKGAVAPTIPSVVVSTAQAAKTPVTGTPVTGPNSAPPPAARPGGLPDTPGRATVQRVCTSCHSIGMVTAKGHTADGWSEVIGKMMANGMEASDDDLQTIHAYLTREFKPK